MIISFLIDGIISKYAPYSILSLIYLFFLKSKNSKKYYIISFSIGLLFDYFYSGTLLYNSFIFLETAFLIKKLKIKLTKNIKNYLLIVVLIVINYYIISFLILSLVKYISFDYERYFNILINSLELNIVSSIIMYLIYAKKHKINW